MTLEQTLEKAPFLVELYDQDLSSSFTNMNKVLDDEMISEITERIKAYIEAYWKTHYPYYGVVHQDSHHEINNMLNTI